MAPELLWLCAGVAGYALAMVCNPLRGFFVDGFNLLRERGRVRLWLPVGVASLLPLSFHWFPTDDAAAAARAPAGGSAMARAALADGGALFVAAAGFKTADEARALPARERAALSIGALFWCALAIGQQFFVLTALYLGALLPERDPGWKGLIDLAWRRLLRFWPGILIAAAFPIIDLWAPAGGFAGVAIWILAAVFGVVFAFVQPCLLSGERGMRAATRSNFECWAKLPYDGFWFIAIVALHLFVLHLADRTTSALLADRVFLPVAWDILFAVLRAGVMVWLLATWVLLYCAKTKNPSKRRIRP